MVNENIHFKTFMVCDCHCFPLSGGFVLGLLSPVAGLHMNPRVAGEMLEFVQSFLGWESSSCFCKARFGWDGPAV